MIITEGLIDRAVNLVSPTAEAILAAEGMTWGPKWVDGALTAPGLSIVQFRLGEKTDWNPRWGEEKDFFEIAMKKLQLTRRLGDDSSTIAAVCPWRLEEGEFFYPGGVTRFGISAATSGAKGRTDEALANILVSTIIMLAHLEADGRKEAKQMQI